MISDEDEIPVEITEPMAFAPIIPILFQTRGDFLNRRTKKLVMQKESCERDRKMKRKKSNIKYKRPIQDREIIWQKKCGTAGGKHSRNSNKGFCLPSEAPLRDAGYTVRGCWLSDLILQTTSQKPK